jgi:hypothetical protein
MFQKMAVYFNSKISKSSIMCDILLIGQNNYPMDTVVKHFFTGYL